MPGIEVAARGAYADALDILFKPGWSVTLVDMVLHEVTRNQTPTSARPAEWAASARIPVLPTRTFAHFRKATSANTAPKKYPLGELAIQEAMNEFAFGMPPGSGVFLFEDQKLPGPVFCSPTIAARSARALS